MTRREMTEEDEAVAADLRVLRGDGLHSMADRIDAHLAALRARAEAAEADNAALLKAARGPLTECSNPIGTYRTLIRSIQNMGEVVNKPHPGTGYRAKVRAELLLELAREHDRRSSSSALNSTEAKLYAAVAVGIRAQAAREEQGG